MKPTDMNLPGSGLGRPVTRKEDPALIRGEGAFPSDHSAPDALHMVLLRSDAAHADFELGGLDEARDAPGVAAILTAGDLGEFGALPSPGLDLVARATGQQLTAPRHPLLAEGRVRHVGEPLACIVADSVEAAKDAAEAILVDYREFEVVLDAAEATDSAVQLHDGVERNLLYEAEIGDRSATDTAFETAYRVVELKLVNNRIVANYLEPRSVLADHDRQSGRTKLVVGSQGVHGVRNILCGILGCSAEELHIVTPPDVGGGFGTRAFAYREYALAAIASRVVDRPVRWLADRTEHFLADYQGRDHVTGIEMAVDKRGRFLAMRVDTTANLGAYPGQLGAFVPYFGAHMDQGAYDIGAVHITVRGVLTNTVPTDAYRGAGRPEAAFLIERIADRVGRELNISQDEIRRRNYIAPDKFPYATKTGRLYDVGDFNRTMDRAMALADWQGFEQRLELSRGAGRLRGIGMVNYIEACSGFAGERCALTLQDNGDVLLTIGSQATGQGHQTAFAQIAADHLGLPIERIDVIQGDSDRVATGSGTGGSRSIPVGSVIVDRGAAALCTRIRSLAADMLEAAPGDIELTAGVAAVVGTDRSVAFAELAARAAAPISETADWSPDDFTYPNGTHICEVEIDPETGSTQVVRYLGVDDFGVVVNPLLLDGQMHGGIAQGIGQALMEQTIYEPGSGQLLTASFMDYRMPRAGDFPSFGIAYENIPSTNNPLGIKGAGEAGTIAATPCVMNAVVDALHRAHGIKHIDMPATPQAVWQAIREAQ